MEQARENKCTVRFEPSGLKVEVPAGTVLLEAAHKAGIYLGSICGGDGECGKCKVIIDDGKNIQTKPTSLLTQDEIRQNVVLACRSNVLADITVTVPQSHTLQTSRILMDSDMQRFGDPAGNGLEGLFRFDPLVKKFYVEMSPPTVHDHTADHERLCLAVRKHAGAPILQAGLQILQNLSGVLQSSGYKVTVTIGRRGRAFEIIRLEVGDRSGGNFAVAVDLGTTTVVAHLVDLTNAETLDSEAVYNSQIHYGEDYIRRIIYAEKNQAFDRMQSLVVDNLNGLIATLAERQNINFRDITAIICAGNTAMMHFLLKLDPSRIRREPYVASANFIPPVRAAEIGIRTHPQALLYCLPGVAAYVGGDIVAGVLATRVFTQNGICLFADIGTNGEVVLGNRHWLICASSSAGPAFEGSGIKHGARAGAGAIEKLTIHKDGSVEFKTIESKPPVGICGSGLLDTLAELFTNGIIDRTGRFITDHHPALSQGDEGLQFRLVPAENEQQEIVITQADINNLIRSKAGVFAAIRVLMESTQTKLEDLEAVYLAGGFGNFLNIRRAVTIGMLPDVPLEKIHYVGNTSIAGAKTVLLSRKAQETAEQIANSMTYFDLMSHPQYMEEFIRAKFLPHTDLSLFPSVAHIKSKV
jgi:uncharacterized 2Fe-2S/4Fe-4S cluster protein (DUF4445 family)